MAKGITLQELDTTATSRLVIKDSAGRAKVTEPSAADDIALKSTVDNAVGNLSTLQTTDKGNVVKAINELFTNVSSGKTSIAAAITGKGVQASGSDTFAQLAAKIGQIKSDPEDVIQDTSSRIALIQNSKDIVAGLDQKTSLDDDNNVFAYTSYDKKTAAKFNKNMVKLIDFAVNVTDSKPVMSLDGQYVYILSNKLSGDYFATIHKYTISGVKLWGIDSVNTGRTVLREITASNDLVAILGWNIDSGYLVQFLNPSNGAVIKTINLNGSYSRIAWDGKLGLFVCSTNGVSGYNMAFVTPGGNIQKEAKNRIDTSTERRHLGKELYDFVCCNTTYSREEF